MAPYRQRSIYLLLGVADAQIDNRPLVVITAQVGLNRIYKEIPACGLRQSRFMKYAECFGAKGYFIEAADDLLPTLKKALAEDTVSVIACPVDYSENAKLTDKLGDLTQPL